MMTTAAELKLGDVVSTHPEDPFSTCVVRKIVDGMVHLYRPYAVTSDFSYTGGVIPYIGIEEFAIHADSREVKLYSRKEVR